MTGPEARAVLPLVWRAPLGALDSPDEGTDTRPALLDGRLFVGMGRTVLALDPATGERLWRSEPGEYGKTGRLLARDGRVFASGREVVALDAATGFLLWRQPLTDPAYVADAVDETTVYVGTRYIVHAFDVATGTRRWAFDARQDWPLGGALQGITVSGDTVYATGAKTLDPSRGGQSGILVALDRRDGSLLWRWESPLSNRASDVSWAPTIVGRKLIAATGSGSQVFALDRFTRVELWRTESRPVQGIWEGVVIVGDTIYTGSMDGTASAHDLNTGRLLWRSEKTAASITAIEVCDDRVFAVNLGFETLDRHTGQRRLSGLHGGGDFIVSGPVASNHVVFMTGVVAVYAFRCTD
jgi:outer membrane protein assembly factor BamB